MINPVEKTNVSDQVYNMMLEMVATKKWKEGEKIPSENVLSAELQVSRNTVRQAIQKMAALGILETRQGYGTHVKKIDTSFYMNILLPTAFLTDSSSLTVFEFEKSIQVESVKQAAAKASREEIDGLQLYLEKMRSTTDPREFYDYDFDYHIYITLLSKNEMFVASQRLIKRIMQDPLVDLVANYGTVHSIEYHESIYRLLAEGKGAEAAAMMDEHMSDLLKKLEVRLQARAK